MPASCGHFLAGRMERMKIQPKKIGIALGVVFIAMPWQQAGYSSLLFVTPLFD
jgi:hypothetical protein